MISIMLIAYALYIYEKQSEKENNTKNNNIKYVQKISTIIGAFLTILGVITYYGEKKIEYKSNFTANKFWFSLPSCRGKTPKVPILRSLKAAIVQ